MSTAAPFLPRDLDAAFQCADIFGIVNAYNITIARLATCGSSSRSRAIWMAKRDRIADEASRRGYIIHIAFVGADHYVATPRSEYVPPFEAMQRAQAAAR